MCLWLFAFGCEEEEEEGWYGLVVGLCCDCSLGWWCLIADWTLESGR